jgi:hypothetical protein
MKNRIYSILAIIVFSAFSANAQTKAKIDPAGTWKFEVPTASGSTRGNIIIDTADKKLTVTMSITGTENSIPGKQVKVSGDSLTFQVYFQGEEVNMAMKMESDTNMSGIATHSEGDIPLTVTKENKKPEK